MPRSIATAELYLDDRHVGTVQVHGRESSWGWGDFKPNGEFAQFAPLFGEWSLLIHADDQSHLSPAASEELRKSEFAIDKVKARLHFPATNEWQSISQLNIDGPLIEWKEGA